ncbi:MAG: NAD kinase [Lactobacillales bacterium]|jgi:NAD+ kinase|nr:NAD kinase [Lactobacillales bacterium]
MKVSIFHNQEEQSFKAAKKLKELLLRFSFVLDEKKPDVVLSVGGDGTLLSAFHKYEKQLDKVQFVGIHIGHLGFYTDWREFEMEELVRTLNEKSACSVSYPLLDVVVEYEEGLKHFLALNESTVRRVSKTLVGDVYISDEFFESFRGDGLSVSTPTGSTAHNKSIGGAVIHPSVNAIQMTEIASLNNRLFRTLGSPIVIGAHEWIRIQLAPSDDYTITVDREMVASKKVQAVDFKIAKERIHFVSYRHLHFWNRVKESFITGQNSNHAFDVDIWV